MISENLNTFEYQKLDQHLQAGLPVPIYTPLYENEQKERRISQWRLLDSSLQVDDTSWNGLISQLWASKNNCTITIFQEFEWELFTKWSVLVLN